ncbi:hypothetical protein [Halobacillus halophilus]|uniref:hypothetical protein n=1 Tax=Halobacillus halophilus TaxID=1570 RepID=UPI001CD765E3|nr:hypothetical protein [Halobacillus halophilus]MCA1011691.1 hypothetical protein [Halobacillus halophilus]
MKNNRYKEKVQQKYRTEIKKKNKDKNAHYSLLGIIIIVLILTIIAFYLGIFDDGSEFIPYPKN